MGFHEFLDDGKTDAGTAMLAGTGFFTLVNQKSTQGNLLKSGIEISLVADLVSENTRDSF